MVNNPTWQMAVEGAPLQAVDGKRFAQLSTGLLLGCKFSQADGGKTGVKVKVQFVTIAALAIGKPRSLFGIAQQKLDLKVRAVTALHG